MLKASSPENFSFSIINMTEAKIENTKCAAFDDFEHCAGDKDFCLHSCHFLACLSDKNELKDYHIIGKQWPDSETALICPNDTSGVRYDLELGKNDAVPALMIFVMTILSGLLALFAVIVLHYNCIVSLRG